MALHFLTLLMRNRRYRMTPVAMQQIREQGDGFESTGTDPQLRLVSNRPGLPRRWVFIRYQADDPENILAPVLYYDTGGGYHETGRILLPHSSPKRSELIRLPYNVRGLRLDPADRTGRFTISSMDMLEVGFVPLVLLLAWRELRDASPAARLHTVLEGFKYLFSNGAVAARDRLAERHRLYQSPRIFHDYPLAETPAAPAEQDWQSLQAARQGRAAHTREPVVDVIIPVYDGHDVTLRCIYQVLSVPVVTDFELMVVNDCSPDPLLAAKLRELAASGLFVLRENSSNSGFVRTANEAMQQHLARDVVLLNADAIVCGDWLDRLRAAAHAAQSTGSVTPFSNNAEICSYPWIVRDNLMRLELADEELDAIAARVNHGITVPLPTGVGFCLYIRRDCLADTGYFDEQAFGRGYGEENDFCLRSAARGWQHVLAADVFVRHVGGASFGTEKPARVAAAMRVINTRYPGYHQDVQRFIQDDPLAEYRARIDLARLRAVAHGPVFLFVCHNWGGGTEKHVRELVEGLAQEQVRVGYLRPDVRHGHRAVLAFPDVPFLPNLPGLDFPAPAAVNARLLSATGVSHVHIHNLAGFDAGFVRDLPEILRLAGLPYDCTLHDYLAICPRIHLTEPSGQYCGEPEPAACNTCIHQHGSPFGKVDIDSWRADCRALLTGARCVFVPSHDVALRIGRYYPDVVCQVRPHMEKHVVERVLPDRSSAPDSVVRVAVVGAIGSHKGSWLLQRCARAAYRRNLPLEFVVIGYTDIEDLAAEPNISVTGRYEEAELHELIRHAACQLAFFPSTWPETWCYTLTQVLNAGLAPVAFDIGAIAGRMRSAALADRLMPGDYSKYPDKINEFLLDCACRGTLLEAVPDAQVEYHSLLVDYYGLARDEATS